MGNPLSDDLILHARRVAGVLGERGVAHAFIGGLAVNAWAVPTPTYDIDVCASLTPEEVPLLIQRLEKDGFIPPPSAWLESVGPARFQEFTLHWAYGDRLRAVDIFLATDPFQQEALVRSRGIELETGFHARVATPEDLVIYKLLANRPKDRAAVERLLILQTGLDLPYLWKWGRRFNIVDRLREALGEAGYDRAALPGAE